MALLDLPNEILLSLARSLDEKDINNLVRTNRRLYHTLNQYLYTHNVNYFGGMALLWAAYHGLEGTFKKLLDAGANPNIMIRRLPDKTWVVNPWPGSPIKERWVPPRLNTRSILRNRVRPRFYIPSLQSPLHMACSNGHLAVVRILFQRSDVNPYSAWAFSTPLIKATKKGQLNVVKYLLHQGIDPNVPYETSNTALRWAIDPHLWEYKPGVHEAIAKLLLAQPGIQVNRCGLYGRSLLTIATARKDVGLVRMLLVRGANPNEKSLKDDSPLREAMKLRNRGRDKERCKEIAKLLLAYGADPFLQDICGRSAYQATTKVQATETWNLFREQNPKPIQSPDAL